MGRMNRHCPRNSTGWSDWKETHDSLSEKESPRSSVRDQSHRLGVFGRSFMRLRQVVFKPRARAVGQTRRKSLFLAGPSQAVVFDTELHPTRVCGDGLNFARILETSCFQWAPAERTYGEFVLVSFKKRKRFITGQYDTNTCNLPLTARDRSTALLPNSIVTSVSLG